VPIEDVHESDEQADVFQEVEFIDMVCFRDLVSVLSGLLSRRECVVLRGLAEGLQLGEIASKFRLSYPTALKYRRRIAKLISELGCSPATNQRPSTRKAEHSEFGGSTGALGGRAGRRGSRPQQNRRNSGFQDHL
jgi:hypothetical protein